MMKENKNPRLKAFLILLIIFSPIVIITKFAWRDMQKNHIYRVGKITKIQYIGKSDNNIYFVYTNEIGSSSFDDDSTKIYKSNIGKRFIVKMSDKEWVNSIFFTYKLYLDKPVPDSIKSEPKGGWQTLPIWAE